MRNDGFRLYHDTYTAKDGSKRGSPKWSIEFTYDDRPHRLALFTDRRSSAEAGRRIVRLAADVAAHGRATEPELLTWASGLPERIRKRLGKWGLLPAERVAAGVTLDEHIERWIAALKAKGASERQRHQQKHRAKRLIRLCGFKRLSDIDRNAVTRVLTKLRDGVIDGERRIGERTSNGHAQAIYSFARWAVREGLLSENPLADGAGRVAVTDEKERDALSVEEQVALITAAESGGNWRGLSGADRGLIYRAALATGFRASELIALRARDFDLTANPPCVHLAAQASKNRQGATQPLPADVASLLRPLLARKLPAAPAIKTPSDKEFSRMLKRDLAAARAAFIDAKGLTAEQRADRERSDTLLPERHNGRIVTFHSLRHSYAANLKRSGTPLATAMQLMRHSDPKLTARRYGSLSVHDLSSAVASLPVIPTTQNAAATGTNDSCSAPYETRRDTRRNSGDAMSAADASGRRLPAKRQRAQVSAESSGYPQEQDAERRGGDSNPRYRFTQYDGLANRYLKPLGHLSRSPAPRRAPLCSIRTAPRRT
jgi:integrase/recombinase XerC